MNQSTYSAEMTLGTPMKGKTKIDLGTPINGGSQVVETPKRTVLSKTPIKRSNE